MPNVRQGDYLFFKKKKKEKAFYEVKVSGQHLSFNIFW